MEITVMHFSENEHNEALVRRLAKSKDLRLAKIRNQPYYKIFDCHDGKLVAQSVSLADAYEIVMNYDF